MDKKEKLFMAALGWLHDGLLFGCLFLIPAAVPGQGRTAGILTGSGLLLGLMSAVSWLCVRKLRSGVLYGAAAALLSGAAALLAFFLGRSYGIVWQTALPAAVLLFSLMLFGMRATDKIRKNRAARELREMPGVIPDGQKGGLAEILDEPAPPHLLLFGAVYLWAVTQDASEVWNRVFILLLADLFVCLIWGYLDRMENFIQTHRHVARLPVRAMKRTGLGILGFLAVCLALLVLPAALYGKEPLADIELPKSEFTIQMETEEMEMPVGNDPISMQELLGEGAESKEMPRWLENTLTVLAFGICAAAAVLVLRLLYRTCKDALRSFGEEGREEITFLGEEPEKEESFWERRSRKRQEQKSPDGQIRRLYRQEIRRGLRKRGEKGKILSGAETPRQAEEKAGLSGNAGQEEAYLEQLHEGYERARYQGGCAKEEAQKLLEASRQRR